MDDGGDTYTRFVTGLIEALHEAHTDLAQSQFNAGIVADGYWIPHVAAAEDLEADLIEVGAVEEDGQYLAKEAWAATRLVAAIRVGRVISAAGVHGRGC